MIAHLFWDNGLSLFVTLFPSLSYCLPLCSNSLSSFIILVCLYDYNFSCSCLLFSHGSQLFYQGWHTMTQTFYNFRATTSSSHHLLVAMIIFMYIRASLPKFRQLPSNLQVVLWISLLAEVKYRLNSTSSGLSLKKLGSQTLAFALNLHHHRLHHQLPG